MCGIVGYAGFTQKISLTPAINVLHHRGPDDNGIEYFEGVGLGNLRLAIIDLSKNGHQPMFNHDKSLCITFNGEIYNFSEVRKLLEKKYRFRSNSDTEVILYAYQEWGVRCLDKLNGMFSFVIYDNRKRILFGARDRLGQKPLKYYFENGKFIFASEIKAILSILNLKPELDETAIDNFLTFQYVPSPRTGFKKIFKLPPAHYFIYKDNKLSIQRYWSLSFRRKLKLSYKEWIDLVFAEIERAVKSHLISDVPVGALLSGGLDSSTIVAIMARNSPRKIKTFSIGFDDDQFNEAEYAATVSKMYKTEHTQFTVTSKDLLENISNLANVYDEPIGDNSILPTLLVSKLTGAKVRVALTGDGGDENFAGYDRYTFVNIASFIAKLPPMLKKAALLKARTAFLLRPNKLTERMNRFFSSLDDQFYRKYVNYNSFFNSVTKRTLYSDDFRIRIGDNDSYENYSSYFDEKLNDLDNSLRIDIHTYLPDDLLYKTDAASMAYSLELRSPFLDYLLMEKMAAMPSQIKIKLLTKKKILKDIATSYNLLPKEIVYRRKQGFNIPQNKWFKGPLKKYLNNQILSSRIVGVIFDKRKIETYMAEYMKTSLNYDNNIFALLILSLWFDRYFE